MPSKTSGFLMVITFLLLITAAGSAADNDIARHRACNQCGMDRKMYGYSRMLIGYADGTQAGLCSLHCAVTEMNLQQEKRISFLQVADRNSHELIAAEKAFWTIGGSKRGVMTPIAKWAFAGKESAELFVAEYGGKVIDWEIAMMAARKDAEPIVK